MQLNPPVNEDSETAATWGSYTESPPEGTLSAELLRVAKLRDAISAQFQIIVTITTAPSVISEGQQKMAHFWDKWRANLLTPAHSHLPRLLIHVNTERTSHQQESPVTELIANVRTSSDIPFGKRLAARLESLVETSKEEFPEQEPMSRRSLHDFLAFIRSVPGIAYPDVVLTYEGHIRPEWTKSRNKHFAVEFLGGNEVRFVIFAPDPKKPYKTNRASGLSALHSLMELVHPYGVFDWITDLNEKAA